MFSARFQRPVLITRHARQRMADRAMDDALVLDMIDTGTAKYKDAVHLWLYKSIAGRADNLLCAAAELKADVLVIKTVMHHFQVRS